MVYYYTLAITLVLLSVALLQWAVWLFGIRVYL